MTEVIIIAGMVAVTFGIRYLPFLTANRIILPEPIGRGLKFVPVAVLSAIIATVTLMPDGKNIELSFTNAHLDAAIIAFGVAMVSKNMLLTVVIGLIAFAILKIGLGY